MEVSMTRRSLLLAALCIPAALPAQDIAGDWKATLKAGAAEFRLALHIAKADTGFKATLDSLDQGVNGIPVSGISFQESKLKLKVDAVAGSYEGALSADGASIQGTWTQGQPLPLTFTRVKDAAELKPPRRPQEPVKPYPYREEEVSYENKSAGIRLAGTLTLPQGKGPFPAVLLITGSGAQDRDESLMGHKPFLVLADYLTRKGIAVLRVDDRGMGQSGGAATMATATTADFATDVEAGLAWLKTRPEVNARKIGLLGHSEGGVIAPLVASRNPDAAFIVMLAGTAVPGDQVIVEQVRLLATASGATPQQAEQAAAKQKEVLALVKQEKDAATLRKKLQEGPLAEVPGAQADAALQSLTSPWYRYFLEYDPAPALAKVKCPVLALDGGKDTQVSAKQNLPVIRKTLEAAGNKDFEALEMPGLNHLFQTAKTGAVTEYAQIEETASRRLTTDD
ncbi:MAG: alpha/beta fold hydrolase [Acidobacteriia bacterium]|nr:alpha/beta fold hydrolase [Terriglobia bacterium]